MNIFNTSYYIDHRENYQNQNINPYICTDSNKVTYVKFQYNLDSNFDLINMLDRFRNIYDILNLNHHQNTHHSISINSDFCIFL